LNKISTKFSKMPLLIKITSQKNHFFFLRKKKNHSYSSSFPWVAADHSLGVANNNGGPP